MIKFLSNRIYCDMTVFVCMISLPQKDSVLTCASSAIYSPPTTVTRECSSFLQEQRSCLGLAGGDILIPSANNIDDLHTRANLFLSSLPILNPSPACQAVVEQFICYFIFGLCDSGELYQPSSTQCTTVTSDICGPEFMMAMALAASLPELIPQCDTLPDTQTGDCSGSYKINHTAVYIVNPCPIAIYNHYSYQTLYCVY